MSKYIKKRQIRVYLSDRKVVIKTITKDNYVYKHIMKIKKYMYKRGLNKEYIFVECV